MIPIRVTNHAVERFQARVIPGSSKLEARLALQQFVSMGSLRPNPRHWMSPQRSEPGTRFLYWARRPGICAIVKNGWVVTVVTRVLVRQHLRVVPSSQVRPRPSTCDRWRWRWCQCRDCARGALEADMSDEEAA